MLNPIQFKLIYFSLFLILLLACKNKETEILLADEDNTVTLVYDSNASHAVKTAVRLFADDIYKISGKRPKIASNLEDTSRDIILIGSISESDQIKTLYKKHKLDSSPIEGAWEKYQYHVTKKRDAGQGSLLIIAGSDPRGAAYGLLDLSKKMGVSPWHYWADVVPTKQETLSLRINDYTSTSPSVKFRGIFLNDEDWGLQPWAAKTLEPETGDIGPRTYAHIFELLLRLKANLIWPAMHPCTDAFFLNPENVKVAEQYGIVLGSSHCEQMLCNNVGEWEKDKHGAFNYFNNGKTILSYWENRVKETQTIDGIYTLGLRGVHDSGIEGAASMDEKVNMVKQVIADQRNLLSSHGAKPITDIPQVLIPYKEVLDIYDKGIELPDDVTLIWPDDNYGYIRRLSSESEQARSGGAGVYYHASYWGRPHDYLWLSSTNPWLIWEEMNKAYSKNARDIWVLNVGDIKPLEYNIDLFLDMAWNISPYDAGSAVKKHMTQWFRVIFGSQNASLTSNIMQQYYQLAFERRPEFMGWSQTEPTTRIYPSAYNHFDWNDEAQKRIDSYSKLEKQSDSLYQSFDQSSDLKDAFYQLVYYPVMGASNINKKFLYHQKAALYADQGRLSATEFANKSQKAYNKILEETRYFNEELANGKWRHMMSHNPRRLPVYNALSFEASSNSDTVLWDVLAQGNQLDSVSETHVLPEFNSLANGAYFLDLFLKNQESMDWNIDSDVPWLEYSKKEGQLSDNPGSREQRIWVSVNWDKITDAGIQTASIKVQANKKTRIINVVANKFKDDALANFEGTIENNGIISIYAENFSSIKNLKNSSWQELRGLGHTGASMQYRIKNNDSSEKETSELNYEFFVLHPGKASITLFALPTHALDKKGGLKLSAEMDGNSLGMVNFQTRGRSSAWKQNVLSNTAKSVIQLNDLTAGKHTLTFKGIDEGVILDRFIIATDNNKHSAYSVIPETRLK